MVSHAIIYGLLFAIVGVGVYLGLVFQDNRKKSKQLIIAQEKQAELMADVRMLKETYQSGNLSEEQRQKIKDLYSEAVNDLKKQSEIVASLNQGA